MDGEVRKKVDRKNLLIACLLVITAAAVVTAVWALWFRDNDSAQSLQQLEPSQMPMPNDPGGELEQTEGGGAVNLTYSPEVMINLSESRADFYFANPSRSNQDVIVSLQIGGVTVFRTGRITPGNFVEKQDIPAEAAARLKLGLYDAEFLVWFNDADSGEQAMLETVLSDVVVTVEE